MKWHRTQDVESYNSKKPSNKAPLRGIPFEYAVFDAHPVFAALRGASGWTLASSFLCSQTLSKPAAMLRERKPLGGLKENEI